MDCTVEQGMSKYKQAKWKTVDVSQNAEFLWALRV
jgi:hypothetical protein